MRAAQTSEFEAMLKHSTKYPDVGRCIPKALWGTARSVRKVQKMAESAAKNKCANRNEKADTTNWR